MGLGKTIQVLALLLLHKRRRQRGDPPHLLVVPASLLANWQAEIERFAPSLVAFVAHPSAMPAGELAEIENTELDGVDVVITANSFSLTASISSQFRFEGGCRRWMLAGGP